MESKNVVNNLTNPWHNSYWYARMLINCDKYGGIGKDNKILVKIAATMRLINDEKCSDTKKIEMHKNAIKSILLERFKKAQSKKERINTFIEDLFSYFKSIDDVNVFILTCESIMMPVNQALENIPSNDREFAETIAKTYLDTEGEVALAAVIRLWDDLGIKGCLTVERTEVVKAFAQLRLLLDTEQNLNQNDSNVVLTAFVQEFERRAAQKRKGRAGGSLEDVISFILDYYKIPSVSSPEHFQADIEVDKWIKTKDNWLIGISCKRTLRERWKQVSSADKEILSKFKIKYLFHIITYDEDLSDDKLSLLGGC